MPALRPTVASSRCLFAQQGARTFSTTPRVARQTPTHLKVPVEKVPDYPYGEFRWYKQRNSGLYGGARIRFGNTISEKWNIKAPAQWKPNRHTKRLWSPALGMFIRTRLTTRVLKTIDKLGGIDEYLLGTKSARIKDLGPAGWRLRWKVMQSPAIQEKWAKEREALGLPPRNAGAAEEGLSAEELSEVDAMLERGDEFVIGEPEETIEAPFMAEEPKPSIEKAREAAQGVVNEIAGAEKKKE